MTWPVPTPPPPPRVAVTVPVKPSAAKAAVLLLVTERLETVPECSVIEPPLIVDGIAVPVSASILPSKVPMLSPMLSWLLPAAPDAMKVMVWAVDRDGVACDESWRRSSWLPAPRRRAGSRAVFATDGVALLLCVVPLRWRPYRAPQACRAPADYVRRCMIQARSIPIRERKRHAWSSADSWRGWRDSRCGWFPAPAGSRSGI